MKQFFKCSLCGWRGKGSHCHKCSVVNKNNKRREINAKKSYKSDKERYCTAGIMV